MKRIFAILSVSAVVLSSCGKLLDVKPTSAIYDEQIQELLKNGTDEQKQMTAEALYKSLNAYMSYVDEGNWCTSGASLTNYYSKAGCDASRSFMAEDVVLGTSQSNVFGTEEYQLRPTIQTSTGSSSVQSYWFLAQRGITKSLQVLPYMTAEAAAKSDYVKIGRAWALIVRAYGFMDILENFAPAYLYGGKDAKGFRWYEEFSTGQPTAERDATCQITYDRIKADLKEAAALLKAANVGFTTGTTATFEDLDEGVANFLLARAALWTGDYATCISACDAIISSGKYSLIPVANYGGTNTGSGIGDDAAFDPKTNAFTNLKVNPEVILGYSEGSSYRGNVGAHAGYFNCYAGGISAARVNDVLYNKMNDNDVRKAQFVAAGLGTWTTNSGGKAAIPTYVSTKWAATTGVYTSGKATITDVDYVQFRLSEVYLMKAEAQAMSTGDAAATLNTLLAARTLPGKPALTASNYGGASDIKEQIKLQWRIEMWGEGGRGYYNLKRWNQAVNRSGNHWSENKTWSIAQMTYPLPDNETLYAGE